ncbi:ANTAR domain-containing protein [Egicoccus sp. AB-alg6-2]|uniref:ANTAR domain-containing protein n=1 Tax=Egicoccus sp. AB-alg6-2 TaxID=3242692 RepID=UPI00359CFA18
MPDGATPTGPADDDLVDLASEPHTGYAAALTRLNRLLLDGQRLHEVLAGVVEGVRLAVPSLAAVSVTTIGEDGTYTTAVATDQHAIAVDQVEYDLHLGPCVLALETGEDQFVDDVRTDTRWGPFNDKAREEGFLSAAGIALNANGRTYGALNLFSDESAGIGPDTRRLCNRLAPSLAATLANARAHLAAERLSEQLQQQLEAIAVLHQAVGVLMAERGCDPETAGALLERAAEATNRTVRDVATQIVGSVADSSA